jgi:hypothetical protein
VAIGYRAFLVALVSQETLLALTHGSIARLIHLALAMTVAHHVLVGVFHTRAGELAQLAKAGVVAATCSALLRVKVALSSGGAGAHLLVARGALFRALKPKPAVFAVAFCRLCFFVESACTMPIAYAQLRGSRALRVAVASHPSIQTATLLHLLRAIALSHKLASLAFEGALAVEVCI